MFSIGDNAAIEAGERIRLLAIDTLPPDTSEAGRMIANDTIFSMFMANAERYTIRREHNQIVTIDMPSFSLADAFVLAKDVDDVSSCLLGKVIYFSNPLLSFVLLPEPAEPKANIAAKFRMDNPGRWISPKTKLHVVGVEASKGSSGNIKLWLELPTRDTVYCLTEIRLPGTNRLLPTASMMMRGTSLERRLCYKFTDSLPYYAPRIYTRNALAGSLPLPLKMKPFAEIIGLTGMVGQFLNTPSKMFLAKGFFHGFPFDTATCTVHGDSIGLMSFGRKAHLDDSTFFGQQLQRLEEEFGSPDLIRIDTSQTPPQPMAQALLKRYSKQMHVEGDYGSAVTWSVMTESGAPFELRLESTPMFCPDEASGCAIKRCRTLSQSNETLSGIARSGFYGNVTSELTPTCRPNLICRPILDHPHHRIHHPPDTLEDFVQRRIVIHIGRSRDNLVILINVNLVGTRHSMTMTHLFDFA